MLERDGWSGSWFYWYLTEHVALLEQNGQSSPAWVQQAHWRGAGKRTQQATCSILGKETKILVPEEMGQKWICASRAPGVGAKLVKPKLQEVLLKALAMTQPNGWPDDADGGAKTRTGIITGISCFQNLVLTRTSGLDQILQLWGRNPWKQVMLPQVSRLPNWDIGNISRVDALPAPLLEPRGDLFHLEKTPLCFRHRNNCFRVMKRRYLELSFSCEKYYHRLVVLAPAVPIKLISSSTQATKINIIPERSLR